MRVYLGSDHAGYELKGRLLDELRTGGHEAVDCGPAAFVADDDYPPYILRAAASVVADPGSLGIVIGGSGNGEAIAANKVPGARAALAWSDDTARLAREHNDANVISLGARMTAAGDAVRLVRIFLDTAFSGEQRHVRRIAMLTEYERSHEIPAVSSR